MKSERRTIAALSICAFPISAMAKVPDEPGSYLIVGGVGFGLGLLIGYLLCRWRCRRQERRPEHLK